ncbi:MAG: TOBE domain-containing protein, partial [Mesorhizobium sp.]
DQARPVNALPATVGDVIYQGDSFICYATLRDGRQVTLRDYCRSDVLAKLPAPGEPIALGIDAQDVVLVSDQ